MRPLSLEKIESQPTPLGGQSRSLVNNPHLRLVNLLLGPGEKVDAHTAPVEVVFLVLEGRGRIIIGDEAVDINCGEFAVCPPDVKRAVEADTGSRLSLLVVRCPNL